jgi:hypothetical protein
MLYKVGYRKNGSLFRNESIEIYSVSGITLFIDRGGDYASAAVAGAPQAIQCADIRYDSLCSKQTHQLCARLEEVDTCSTDLLYSATILLERLL